MGSEPRDIRRRRWPAATALLVCMAAAGTALGASPDVVVSQVYGGGGNSGATYKNDFIELYNAGGTVVNLAGWSVQYASASGTSWQVTNLSGSLQPGQYYLVQEAAGSGGTTNLPTPDATGSIAMSATAGKVALVTSTTALSCGSNCAGSAGVRDFVGFGAANNYEGSGPTPAPGNTTAVLRAGNGAIDSDNNAADFATGAPNPRNSAVASGQCGADNGKLLAAHAPSNLCSAGTPSAVTGSGHPWSWSCTGRGGGATASCSATIKSYTLSFASDSGGGISGPTPQSVDWGASSSPVTAVPTGAAVFLNWTGQAGFTSTANPLVLAPVTADGSYTAHYATGPVNGLCGNDNGQVLAATAPTQLCSAGLPSAVSGNGHPWTWSCTGINGGSNASCSATIRTYTLNFSTDGSGSLSGSLSQQVDHGADASPVTAIPANGWQFRNWTGDNGLPTSTSNPLTLTGVTADHAVVAHFGGNLTIFHTNDVHARLTPHSWIVNQHGTAPAVFEQVGGAAYLAGKMEALVAGNPTALVLDGGDISEGNPVGDMNGANSGGYGNGGMTTFYEMLHAKLAGQAGRGGRGIDALVVGNHDVRDVSYITNMEHMAGTGVPVISANVRDLNCTTAHPRYPSCEHFPPTTTVTVNGIKVGIIGYTTSSAQVGASLADTLTVVDCQWTGSATCNIAPYVNDLRNNQGAQLVILLTHDGHSDLVDPKTPVIADTADAKVPEIAVTGHWHTWAATAWQPAQLNYKTIFTESASFMAYIGELTVGPDGGYVNATQHVLRNADITPDPDIAAFVSGLIATYNANNPTRPVDQVLGYSNDDLLLDDRMKWWSADEFPWNGNNTAGQWITDAMLWNCGRLFSGGCDLAIEAGGGVRADIPAGPVTWMNVYETFPWADDTYVRISMTGQDIINFIVATNLDTGFSAGLDVTAVDGIPTQVLFNGQPIGRSTVYKVAINNYMLAHPPSGYAWPPGINAETDPSGLLVRDSLATFMLQAHGTPATAYSVGGPRYHFNGSFSGGYTAVVTMMNDNDSAPAYEDAFIRLLSATPETLARRGSAQVPSSLVAADGSVIASNRFAEIELYRSFLGFKTGALKPGDIIQVWGKAGFYGGNPEFVDQEGIYADRTEFNIIGHDESLAQPAQMGSIGAFWNDERKNHYVQFLGRKTGTDTVADQYGQTIKIWDATAYNSQPLALPGNAGDVIQITGVPTMENYALRFRRAAAVVSGSPLPGVQTVSSSVAALPPTASAPLSISASTSTASSYYLSPVADAQVSSGNANTNYGSSTNLFVQSSTSGFGNERAWLRFDLSGLPTGVSVTAATLQLWNWKSSGASLAAEVRGGSSDGWTEAALTWNNQPAFGAVLDTQTLASGASNLNYLWNVTPFVQQKLSGNKLVSLLVKPASEGSTDATAPSYAFDAKEYGSNLPQLLVQAQGSLASVQLYVRYSADNVSWTGWAPYGAPMTQAPYALSYPFPNGNGTYQFYSIATDAQGRSEPTPDAAQASVQYTAAQPAPQSISFPNPGPLTVGSSLTLTATASSGLGVVFSSQTPAVCSVSGNQLSGVAAGSCSVAADQPGNAQWAAAPTVANAVTVNKRPQAITSFTPIANQVLGSGPLTLSASASSGLAVVFATQTPTVCSVNGSSLTLVAVGACSVSAGQPGDATWDVAPTVSQSFQVTAAGGGSAIVPLPPYALGLLGLGLAGLLARRARRLRAID